MTYFGDGFEKITRRSKNFRSIDPLAIKRRNRDIEISKARRNKWISYDEIMEMEYGKFN
jgi:hypothetical protein